MAYSALIQFIVFGLIIILAKSYFTNTQINTFSKNLIITDTYTTDEIGKYVLLKNKYALDLVLYNLQIERKLDSIKYSALFPAVGSKFGNCKPGSSDYPLICKTPQGRFAGITAIKNEHNVFGYVLAEKQYSPYGLDIIHLLLK